MVSQKVDLSRSERHRAATSSLRSTRRGVRQDAPANETLLLVTFFRVIKCYDI